MSSVGISGVGLIGPGISRWTEGISILRGHRRLNIADDLRSSPPEMLPANERRRVTPLTRMVLNCCEDTVSASTFEHEELKTVFSCSCGDLQTIDHLLCSLTLLDRPVSPTQFHNSVHNAPAGYWSIARSDKSASTSLSAHDSSFVSGLLTATSAVLNGAGPTLLVAYDYPPPPALRPFRQYVAPFAVGLILQQRPAPWSIRLTLEQSSEIDTMSDPQLETLRLGNPAARSLPLLERLARKVPGYVRLPHLDSCVVVDLTQDA